MAESEKALDAREKSLNQLEANCETRLYQGELRVREEVKSEYVSRLSALKQEEAKVQQQKLQIEQSAQKLNRLVEIEVHFHIFTLSVAYRE